jgi:hypothetical protein
MSTGKPRKATPFGRRPLDAAFALDQQRSVFFENLLRTGGLSRSCRGVSSEVAGRFLGKKMGPPLGTGSPERRVSVASVVFTPARGVIHPSFPLRGRWDDPCKVPSKPLPPRSTLYAYRHLKRAQRRVYMHEPSHRLVAHSAKANLLFFLILSRSRHRSCCSKSGLSDHFGTAPKRFREPDPGPRCFHPSSRTPVPVFLAFPRYRFSSAAGRKLAHAPAPSQLNAVHGNSPVAPGTRHRASRVRKPVRQYYCPLALRLRR